ncbi:MAG: hypothetical protein M3R52_08570, partial [Acidobacteriota bacterium]|nr:hypothetical protein [Acidobacteriota bacterium]
IQGGYTGDKSLYFLGVANNVHHEHLKRPAIRHAPPALDDGDQERIYECLERCLSRLTDRSQLLIRQYYAEDKQAKISLRRRLATQLGITLNALRARSLRIREELQVCIERCLDLGE